jgi:hypothetical protein
MNVINAYEPLNPASLPAAAEQTLSIAAGPATQHTLRKSGGRPLSFTGRQLGHHRGARAALWHELNLYQTDEGSYVAEIRVCTAAGAGSDQFHLLVAEDLEPILSFFESYDARQDVSADFALDDPALTPAELLVQAAGLRYRLADAVNRYKSAVGQFLKDLARG